MTDNIVDIGCITNLDLDPDRVLTKAVGNLEGCIVIGYDKEGEEYFASSYADGGTALWLVERFKARLLSVDAD